MDLAYLSYTGHTLDSELHSWIQKYDWSLAHLNMLCQRKDWSILGNDDSIDDAKYVARGLLIAQAAASLF